MQRGEREKAWFEEQLGEEWAALGVEAGDGLGRNRLGDIERSFARIRRGLDKCGELGSASSGLEYFSLGEREAFEGRACIRAARMVGSA